MKAPQSRVMKKAHQRFDIRVCTVYKSYCRLSYLDGSKVVPKRPLAVVCPLAAPLENNLPAPALKAMLDLLGATDKPRMTEVVAAALMYFMGSSRGLPRT